MARDHTRVGTDLWNEPSIRKLKVRQQRAYFLATTQPDLSRCGVVAYRLRRWASFAADDTTAALRKDFDALAKTRHVVVDEDHEELFVRTYIRHDRILAQPNVVAALVADYKLIASPVVRRALLAELRRLWDLDELSAAERGGWLLTFGHYPVEVANDQQATWPFSMKQVALNKLRKAVGAGLRDAMLAALDPDSPDPLPPFDPKGPHGIPAGFGEASTEGSGEGSQEGSAEGSGEPSVEPSGEGSGEPPVRTRVRSPSPTPSPSPSPSPAPALAPSPGPVPAAAAPAPPGDPSPPPRPTQPMTQAVAALRDRLDDLGMTVRWDRLTAGELQNIHDLHEVHGAKALIDAAQRAWQPNQPANSAAAWLGLWRDLRPPRPKVKPAKCPQHPEQEPTHGECRACASDRKALV